MVGAEAGAGVHPHVIALAFVVLVAACCCCCWPDELDDSGAANVELVMDNELPTEACGLVPARAPDAEAVAPDWTEYEAEPEPEHIELALWCRSNAARGMAYMQLDLLRTGPARARSTGAAAEELYSSSTASCLNTIDESTSMNVGCSSLLSAHPRNVIKINL